MWQLFKHSRAEVSQSLMKRFQTSLCYLVSADAVSYNCTLFFIFLKLVYITQGRNIVRIKGFTIKE